MEDGAGREGFISKRLPVTHDGKRIATWLIWPFVERTHHGSHRLHLSGTPSANRCRSLSTTTGYQNGFSRDRPYSPSIHAVSTGIRLDLNIRYCRRACERRAWSKPSLRDDAASEVVETQPADRPPSRAPADNPNSARCRARSGDGRSRSSYSDRNWGFRTLATPG